MRLSWRTMRILKQIKTIRLLKKSIAQNLDKKMEFIPNELVIESQKIFIDNLLSEHDVSSRVYGYFAESDDENPFVDRADHYCKLTKVMFERQ